MDDPVLSQKGDRVAQVDRHLREIADAVEELKTRAEQPKTAAGLAAERVEAIVAAAEASAREIEQRAKDEAEHAREQAAAEAAEHVRTAAAAAKELELRIGELQRQVADLVADLEAAVVDVSAGLRLTTASEPGPVDAEPAVVEEVVEEVSEPEPEPQSEPEAQSRKPKAEPAPAAAAPAAPEGARLVALNMALSGTPREETARYLRENFELDGADALLDEVYARAGS